MTTQQRTSQVPARPRQWADRPMPEVAGVTHRYVETGRLGVHVAEAGSGPPLVIRHLPVVTRAVLRAGRGQASG
jgi:hypothetical protein